MGYLPCTPSSGECAVKTLAAPLISHLLLPNGNIGAIITGVWVIGREGRAVDNEGRLLCLKVCFVCRAWSLGGHMDRKSEGDALCPDYAS